MQLNITKEEIDAIDYAMNKFFVIGDIAKAKKLQSIMSKYDKVVNKKIAKQMKR